MNTDKTKNSSLGFAYPRSSAFIRVHPWPFMLWLFRRPAQAGHPQRATLLVGELS
jgi:hypothetical protein